MVLGEIRYLTNATYDGSCFINRSAASLTFPIRFSFLNNVRGR